MPAGLGCRGELPRDGRQGRTPGAALSCCRAAVPFPCCHRDLRGGPASLVPEVRRRGLRGGPRQAPGGGAWTGLCAHRRLRAPRSQADPGPEAADARPAISAASADPPNPGLHPGPQAPPRPPVRNAQQRGNRGSGLEGWPSEDPRPSSQPPDSPTPAPARSCGPVRGARPGGVAGASLAGRPDRHPSRDGWVLAGPLRQTAASPDQQAA